MVENQSATKSASDANLATLVGVLAVSPVAEMHGPGVSSGPGPSMGGGVSKTAPVSEAILAAPVRYPVVA
jgi:hypothetical protein